VVEVAGFVVFDGRFLACGVDHLRPNDFQGLYSSTELFGCAVITQEYAVTLGRIVDVAGGSYGVEEDVQVLTTASDDDVDCRDILGLVPFETELWPFGSVECDASE
jgi:hypothetical protein